MPRTLGAMMLRPGLGYIGATYGNATSRSIDFVRALQADSIHVLEFTTGLMRIWTSDALLTRVAVSSAVTNGDFNANLANWTDNDEAGAASVWVAGGYMGLTGNGTAAAIRDQLIAVAAADLGVEHALRIVVQRGPVTLRVGSTVGGDEYINETDLGVGVHSLALTPTGDFNIRFQARFKRQILVASANIEAAGVVTINSPYAAANLDYIRASADSLSVDVLFIGCKGIQQFRAERRAAGRAWSLVLYQPEDGPFMTENVSTKTMTPAALSGNTTLTCSVPFFRTTHVGALFRVVSTGQTVSKSLTALNDATNVIRVTGVGADRTVTIVLSALTGSGDTVILERSFDNATWVAVAGQTWNADNAGSAYLDGLDNQIIYYRLKASVYVALTAPVATLSIPTGSITGIGRVVAYTSTTVVDIEVLTDFGDTGASMTWSEGLWSDYRGWPSAGCLYEGRMAWAGYGKYQLSVSDAFDSFDQETVGDSGPIVRTLGSGPLETINWLLPLQRLILGADMAEHSVRSNAFDEPITPTNNNQKPASDRGSGAVQGMRNGPKGFYVQRGGTRVMELFFDTDNNYDYNSRDLTLLVPEVLKGGDGGTSYAKRMAFQRLPDARLHVVLSDGTAAVLVYDSAEKVECWITVTCSGTIEDVCVLPGLAGAAEDQVYYTVAFSINGSTVRYRLKWALEAECQGTFSTSSTLNKQADAFVLCAGGSTVLSGLSHLIGEEVVAWANGKDLGTYTVSGAGTITVTEQVDANGAIVGLSYEALFKSARLGQNLANNQRLDHVIPIIRNTHAQGLEYGPDFTTMDNLPLMEEGAAVDPEATLASNSSHPIEFPGGWSDDARICLRATAPRPCTVLAIQALGISG